KIKAWDEDNFQMPNSDIEVRFIKFIEEIHSSILGKSICFK
ncbi:hypothetical protein HNR52_002003, partial [Thermoanaerobacterium thermosulfurigenes]